MNAAPGTESLIEIELKGDYAVVTLNRPEKRNAMSRDAQRRLWDVLDELRAARTKVVVLTGAGDKSFCAGADLHDTSEPYTPTAWSPESWYETQRRITEHPAVFIAAVNGFALGGGLTLVHNCDLAVAAEHATFGAPEMGFGIYAALAGPSSVKRLQPKHVAEIILTAKRLDAATALRMGIVNEVVAADQLLPRAEALAAHIAGFDRIALDVARQAMRVEQSMDWQSAMDHGFRSTSVIRSMHPAEG